MKLWELAEKYYDLFETMKKKEGTLEERTIWAFKDDVMKETSPQYKLYEEMSNLIHELGEEMDEDSAYEFTARCLSWLYNEEIEDCDEAIYKMDEVLDTMVSGYTTGLTEWINRSPVNVEWLTEALKEFQPEDGYKALSEAQYLCIRRVCEKVLDFLCDKLEGKVEIE